MKTVDALMRSETGETGYLPSLLNLLSQVYGQAVSIRKIGYEKKVFKKEFLPCEVISIGNITVGGTGKTPFTIYLAQMIQKMGMKVAVVSRGYKGSAEKEGGIVSTGDALLMNAKSAGDEPCLMALELKGIPVIVGRDRAAAGRLAIREFHPDVILLDDGFQHLRLARNLDIVLIDTLKPFGNKSLLPRGTLREPVTGLLRGDIFILTRFDQAPPDQQARTLAEIQHIVPGKPIFQAVHEPYIKRMIDPQNDSAALVDESLLRDQKVVAFSGIADNDGFKASLKKWGCFPLAFFSFQDHHAYTRGEIADMLSFSEKNGAAFMVTTEKDYVRLKASLPIDMRLIVIDVRISLGDQKDRFSDFILKKK